MFSRSSVRRAVAASALLLVAACAAFAVVDRGLDAKRWAEAEESLRTDVLLFEEALGSELAGGEPAAVQERVQRIGRATGIRFTLIREDGTVLADSEAKPAAMDNHRERPEVQESLRAEYGVSRRISGTLGVESLYVARAVRRDGALLGWIRGSIHDAALPSGVTTLQWALATLVALLAATSLALGALAGMEWRRERERLAALDAEG